MDIHVFFVSLNDGFRWRRQQENCSVGQSVWRHYVYTCIYICEMIFAIFPHNSVLHSVHIMACNNCWMDSLYWRWSVVKVRGLKGAHLPAPFASTSPPLLESEPSQCCSVHNTHHHNSIKISYYDAWFVDFSWFISVCFFVPSYLLINRFDFPSSRTQKGFVTNKIQVHFRP